MTNKEFRKSISSSCKHIMQQQGFIHADVEINNNLPYVSVGKDGCQFFAQGEDASDLIEKATEASDKTGLAVSTCLIWYLDSAGVWSQPR